MSSALTLPLLAFVLFVAARADAGGAQTCAEGYSSCEAVASAALLQTRKTVSAGYLGASSASRSYVPGEPGAPWTQQEVLTVKAKLWRIFSINQAKDIYMQVHPNDETVDEQWIDYIFRPAPKMLRLGFHDCVKYVDGTGGCDGCLNWENIGLRYTMQAMHFAIPDDALASHNNGLKPVVQLLEAIYTDPAFPARTPAVPGGSLRDLGKSRADLWALATIVAVEYGVYINNAVCRQPSFESDENYWGETTNGPGGARHCHHFEGQENCTVQLPRALSFRSGRRDCVPDSASELPPYGTFKKEDEPQPQHGGEQTVEYFKRNFGFSGRESVAIMGAHVMGRFHNAVSLFRYVWIKDGGMMFNNQYYRNMALRPDYRFKSSRKRCGRVGAAFNEAPHARWVAHTRGDLASGGPVFWIQEKHICPEQCYDNMRSDDPEELECCTPGDVPEGAMCTPDNGRIQGSDPVEADNDVNGGCEKFRFASGFDEMMLPCDIGFYYNFSVDAAGLPHGCPGFEEFTLDKFKKGYHFTWTRQNNRKSEAGCSKNEYSDPGDIPLNQIVEDYADHQDHFLSDFVPALEKMLSSGYSDGELTPAPDQYSDVTCSQAGYWACWTGQSFIDNIRWRIVSEVDGRVVQVRDPSVGTVEMWSEESAEPRQLWRRTREGYFINEGTSDLLGVDGHGSWEMHVDGYLISIAGGGKVLKKAWGSNGASLKTDNKKWGNARFWHLDPVGASWRVLWARGAFGTVTMDAAEFNEQFRAQGTGIIRRECSSCPKATHQDVYLRVGDPEAFDAYHELLDYWTNQGFNQAFSLHSSLAGALYRQANWTWCNGEASDVGFPRDCGPKGWVGGNWNSLAKSDGQPDYQFSVLVSGI